MVDRKWMPESNLAKPACRVCGDKKTRVFPAGNIIYWRCGRCMATFMDASHLPDRNTERKRYERHENDPHDPGYRRFLGKAAVPLIKRLSPGQRGLDYGCGPVPAMSQMMAEAGHFMTSYDPFFFPEKKVLAVTYDFITCTEVAEHFHRPKAEFERLDTLLRPGGYLAVMTCFQTDDAKFENWHYRRDITHVVFYRERTFRIIAAQRGWYCEIPVKDVALMKKPGADFPGL
ncbi:MAG: class I SAM-dependent methyltransferase [Desulfosalsimonadaceae bacterium]